MIALIIGILTSLIITLVGTPLLIRIVHKLNYGQYIRQDGPKSHQVKRGTPTLGGVVIVLAVVLGWCASALYRFCTTGHGPLGRPFSHCSPWFRWVSSASSTISPRYARSKTRA